ncbi:bacillithiol biosynthesis cysteine-adding enzyme BshC [Winogradskyella sp. 3972H.M.0a.05]|uniref:bacillithiol biosynthesis cysteine-adding enzyme BshC n=1 Tax=Winogradskyella sp. 3972H.M.0a.05 TaxID=2950277 RepID=UPI0033957E36
MSLQSIDFKDTGYFSSLMNDYLDELESLKPFYNRFPKLENFKDQIEEKESSFKTDHRTVLVDALKRQYKDVDASEKTLQNIEALAKAKTFTITTGHQLNLFTGPLYFLYKIVSAISLSEALKAEHAGYNFVPIYWMASEDHDFDEINFFNFKGKKIQWNREASGAVGELSTDGLEAVFNILSQEFGSSQNAETLKQLFKKAYLEHDDLAKATMYLANQLFKEYGLVIVDANDSELKRLFIPYVENELVEQTSFNVVQNTSEALRSLSSSYKIQVNPREINLFYLTENLRERIIFEDNQFKVNNTRIVWSESELLKEVNTYPERFSPNVIMRPLYQEVILPNLCYIGGGGELAYWLQLKAFFDKVEVPFPMLLLRNSVLIQTQQQQQKLQKLNISLKDIFLKRDGFINKKVREISNIDIDFSSQREHLEEQFKAMYELAEQTDKSFIGAVASQEKKQIKGLNHLEKRLLKAQKKKLADEVSRMTELQNQLFPNGSLQERYNNFSELYLEYGNALIPKLMSSLNPLSGDFSIITL